VFTDTFITAKDLIFIFEFEPLQAHGAFLYFLIFAAFQRTEFAAFGM